MPPTSTESSIHRRFFLHALRIELLVHIDTALRDGIFFSPARDVLRNDFEKVREALVAGGLHFRHIERAATFDDLEHWLAKIAWKLDIGFLVRARQPYFIADNHDCFGYSWELSQTRWFFARQYADALNQIGAWGARNHDEACTRLKRATG